MTRLPVFAAAGLALALSGCSLFQGGDRLTYAVTLSATGTVPVPPQALGEFTVPVEAANLAQLGLGLAAGLLTHQYNWKQCDFATQVGSPGGGVVVVGVTATCTLQGVPVAEDVVVTFTPA